MKKYLLGIFAVVLAIGMSSFTAPKKQVDSFFWYTIDGQSSLGHDVLPNNGCSTEGDDCAKGYRTQPNDPTSDPADTFVAQDN